MLPLTVAGHPVAGSPLPQKYRVDSRSASAELLQSTRRLDGQPGAQSPPFKSITPMPVPDAPPVGTPELTPVSCRSAHVPLASDRSRPPRSDEEKHVDVSAPSKRLILIVLPARGHTSRDGEDMPTCELAYGARSQRSNGSTDVTLLGLTDAGSSSSRCTTNVLVEP